jgi:cytochrome P450
MSADVGLKEMPASTKRPDIPSFTRDCYEITKVFTYGMPPDEIARVEQAAQRMSSYVARTLDERRSRPRDDFLSAFLALTARIPQLQLDVQPTISGHIGVRRIDQMRVSWRP